MCERYSLTAQLNELSEQFRIGRVATRYQTRPSIAPTQQASVIRTQQGERTLEDSRWGLVPFWGKDAVNAGCEEVADKRAYRKLFAESRCIIPCSGFYVWRSDGKKRFAYRVTMKDQRPFAFAGLFEEWKDTRGLGMRTCTIVTTRANRLLFEYGERMPVIMDEAAIAAWLNPELNREPDYLQSLLQPYDPERMQLHAYPLGELSSSPHEEEPELAAAPQKLAWIKK